MFPILRKEKVLQIQIWVSFDEKFTDNKNVSPARRQETYVFALLRKIVFKT